jgi:MFS family permease
MPVRAFTLAVALGGVFFLITATTFSSLGVILPAMIEEFEWSWTTGGLGFTSLALMTGVFSPIAAQSLGLFGPRGHYALGGAIAATGYLLLGGATGVASYLAATALLGAGFALLANVPGTYLVGRATSPKWRNVAIGAYLAAGGAGGVVGPLAANALLAGGADWRFYWLGSAFATTLIAVAIVALVRREDAHGPGIGREPAASAEDDARASRWAPKAAMASPAFFVIAAALTVAYFCGVTVSTWSVSHLQNAGLPPALAVAMLSLYSASNAGARALGGLAAKRINARTLLVLALLANVMGMSALAFATSLPLAIAFAMFDGFAFGMALFATTALLIDYFGLKNSPALLGGVNLAATIAMLGPTLAGKTADVWGSFAPIFMIYAAGALVAAIAVAMMRDPNVTA